MPEGGLLTIRTSREFLDESFVAAHGFGETGAYACVEITDSGIGMDEETRRKIFEPFFTTKEAGRGTGLGMSIVYGIIKEHRGYITVYSQPGQGTSVRIYLPALEEQPAKPTSHGMSMPNSGTETLLLAEDEEPVRENIAKFLRGYGYTVIEARDGEEALEQFRSASNEVALLILDVLMPQKGGQEVAEEARRIRPDIRILFNSGYPLDLLQRKKILEEGVDFFTKPISPRELLRKVREVLDGKES
jgi:CheY-like chemotaxis protein